MWFVEALLILSILYAAWRLLTKRTPLPPPPPLDSEAKAPGNLSIALFALAVGLVTFVVRIWAPVEWYFEPLHLELASFANYIALFVVGIVAYRRNWLAGLSDAQGKTWAWIAAGLFVVLIVVALASGALTGALDSQLFGGLTAALPDLLRLAAVDVHGDGDHPPGWVSQAFQPPGPASQGDGRLNLCRVRPPSFGDRPARHRPESHQDGHGPQVHPGGALSGGAVFPGWIHRPQASVGQRRFVDKAGVSSQFVGARPLRSPRRAGAGPCPYTGY